MPISTKTQLSIVNFALFFLIIIIGFILEWESYISSDQFFILTFGIVGIFNIINFMINLKADSILSRLKILLTSILITIIIFLIGLFIFIGLPFPYAFIFVIGILIIPVCFQVVDWSAKRKETLLNHFQT